MVAHAQAVKLVLALALFNPRRTRFLRDRIEWEELLNIQLSDFAQGDDVLLSNNREKNLLLERCGNG